MRQALDTLHAAAQRDANLMPAILDCVLAYATLGEICDTLRDVFGDAAEDRLERRFAIVNAWRTVRISG